MMLCVRNYWKSPVDVGSQVKVAGGAIEAKLFYCHML